MWEAVGRIGPEVQSDYDKIRRIPYLFVFNTLTAAALLCTISSPWRCSRPS